MSIRPNGLSKNSIQVTITNTYKLLKISTESSQSPLITNCETSQHLNFKPTKSTIACPHSNRECCTYKYVNSKQSQSAKNKQHIIHFT